ncbi:hypothetical protein [Flavobacterium nitrogenifigens]|uniref:Uncharacterized protein n=1 Tax=Flavobacterium nitrogenifigens TaxID=1617283 RepID=A0A521B2T4_9FLAO|nr:hypothetical protein [Flavobacterium nitrogenifigens]KAF2334612.1 hypothetical protein DM397_08040 [Flavobacterium nitrogenifigens]SMO41407.1 hypothetical protein SAMN06265220_101630 [Flavobacterium nitrogenifigens]
MNEQILSDYCDCINKLWESPEPDDYEVFVNTTYKVWDNLIKASKIKDDFTFYWSLSAVISVTAESGKTNCHYMIGLDLFKRELYFDVSIRNWENIRNLKDEFMTEFFAICTQNDFKFSPDSGPIYDKEITPEFNANYKSNIINLMHNYVTGMLLPEKERGNISFGHFVAVWDASKDMETILSELQIAFKWFYKFNYHLWKAESVRVQNRNNRKRAKM